MKALRTLLVFSIVFFVCGFFAVPWPGLWNEQVTGMEGGGYVGQTLWLFDHAEKAVFHGGPLETTDKLVTPIKGHISPQVPIGLPLLMAPVTHLVGVNVAFCLAAWLGLFLTFFCAFLFFQEISGDFWPGVVAAVLFSLCGLASLQLETANLAAATPFLVPLAGFFLIRYLDRGGPAYGLPSVLLSLAAFYYNMTFGLILAVFALVAAIAALFDEGVRAAFRAIVVAFVPVVLFISGQNPDAWLFACNTNFIPGLPLSFHAPIFFKSMPLAALVFTIPALFFKPHKMAFFLIAGFLFFMLALGNDCFALPGEKSSILHGLYVGLTKILPPNSAPESLSFLTGLELCLCALVAGGHRKILDWREKMEKDESIPSRMPLLTILVFALLIAPDETFKTKLPPVYEHVPQTSGALLELPYSSALDGDVLLGQIHHGKTLFAWYPFWQTALLCMDSSEADWPLPDFSLDKFNNGENYKISALKLRTLGIDTVIVHKDGLSKSGIKKSAAYWEKQVGEPVYEDQDTVIYSF